MSDEPLKSHLNLSAANLLVEQTQRARRILERLAANFAAIETGRPDYERDLVEEKHVRRAAEFLFDSITIPTIDADVFISFSHDDADFVAEMSEKLKLAGITHFKSDRDIRPASDWGESIWDAIAGCRVVVSILTPRFLKSRWRDLEGGAAISSKKTVLTALRYVEPNEVGPPFDRFQSLVVETADQLDNLILSLERLLK